MEVLRERPAAQHTSSPSPAEFDLELPPPPAPFPVDLLEPPAPPIEIPLAATSGAAVAHRNLLSVQTSCVAAITALLPSGDNATQTTSLSPADSRLAAALTDLLEITYELDGLEISPAYQEAEADTDPAGVQINGQVHGAGQSTGEQRERDDFAVLAEHLDALAGGGGADDLDGRLTIGDLRERLLWERVRTLSNIVQVLIQTRSSETQTNDEGQKGREAASKRDQGDEEPESSVANGYHRISTDAHPPDYHDQQSLPSYRPRASCSSADEKDEKADLDFDESLPLRSCNVPISEEKKMRELDDLTSAIEQLGQAAPRYDDQRSELRPRSRQAESESAGQQSVSRTSQKERMKELEEIWQRIERAHGKRRMRDQDAEMHLVGNRRKEQREQYLQDLYDRAEASRMSNQDASFREVDSELEKAKLLRQRGKFLQDLIESSANSRLTNQDASSPAERRQEYVSDLVERSEASRMASQDYPLSAAERMRDRKDNFMDSLIEYSSSGRFVGQDSEPPTPRIRDSPVTVQRKSPYDLVTAEDFLKNLPPAPLDGTNGYGKASENPKRRSTSEFPQNGDGKDKDKTGTLRRIRGMVKTKSISLGLSKGPVDDAFSYIAEYQENLNSVAFMLHGPGLPISSDITLSTGSAPVSGTTDATLKLGSSTTNIRLPTAVRPGQSVTLTASTGTHIHLEAKLSAMPSISTPSMLGTKYPLSAADLRQLAPTSICCADCDRIVASLSPTKASQTWKDLPSEHWAEMIEIWMCHQDPTWTSKLAKHTEEGFWPGQGGLLVGGSYLLVNRDDARRANMVYSDGKDPAWNSLTCLCGEPLGKARTEDSRPGAGTVRLAKWAVALLREDDECGENVEPIRTPLGVFMTADMLELAQAHASYRFVVRDEETDEKRILIWLFNPSISISYRQSQTSPLPSPLRQAFSTPSYQPQRASGGSTTSRRSSIASSKSLVRSPSYNTRDSAESSGIRSQTSSGGGSVGSTQMIRVCKIMYHVMEKGEQFRPPGFGPPPGVDQPNVPQAQLQVEDLRYPGMVCDRLVRALKDSTGVYPVGGRRMGVWDVGFLQRE